MVLIDNLTDAANQQTALQMPDGTTGTLALVYNGATQRWVFSVTHQGFQGGALNGQMLCVHPNILRNFKNLIPFGLAVVTSSGSDPVSVQDFANGSAQIFLLDASDVAAIEESFYGVTA